LFGEENRVLVVQEFGGHGGEASAREEGEDAECEKWELAGGVGVEEVTIDTFILRKGRGGEFRA
jgi:hypothetical protein